MKGTPIPQEQKDRVIRLVLTAPQLTYKQIGEIVGISSGSVTDIVIHQDPPIRRKRGAGSAAWRKGAI